MTYHLLLYNCFNSHLNMTNNKFNCSWLLLQARSRQNVFLRWSYWVSDRLISDLIITVCRAHYCANKYFIRSD